MRDALLLHITRGRCTPGKQITPRPAARKREAQRGERLVLLVLGSLAVLLVSHMPRISQAGLVHSASTTCAHLVASANYASVIGLQAQNQEMAAVQIVNNLDAGAPAALVQVINHNARSTLDAYIFGCTTRKHGPALTRLFTQQGMVQGMVEISPVNTLVTQTLDTTLPPSDIAFLQPLQQNVYHEYAWQHGHFVQILFPGFYPVASRAEAEALQQSFNYKQEMLWSSPITTALQMTRDLLRWSHEPRVQLLSQIKDTSIVEATEQSPHMVVDITLKQLIQPGKQGLWFVTAAHTQRMTINRNAAINQSFPPFVESSIRISGSNALTDGHTTATLFDHTLTPLSRATNIPLQVQLNSDYTGTLHYANLISGQQGVLLIETDPLPKNNARELGKILFASVILR